ncbi:MAG: type II secretion system F family protein [Coriobacteriia bacterium]|nr:type II secretion system F family protein [Coriobacteriia bacterium]
MDASVVPRWLPAVAAIWLGGLGAFLGCWHWLTLRAWLERRRTSSGLDRDWLDGRSCFQSTGAAGLVLRYLVSLERRMALGAVRPWLRPRSAGSGVVRAKELICLAGLEGSLRGQVVPEAGLRLGVMLICVGLVPGSALSLELALVMGAAGLFAGLLLPRWALRRERDARAAALGRELPELLEVMGLGLRSGLSFDRCFALYHQHFPTPFARSCALAQQQWMLGLKSREQGLRDLAAAYDSVLLGRVVETMVRSLRFGTSLAESLESAAQEARADYKAQREEQVAKAPVKMMLPTGTLILPAMLLLVLGPVLLELMEGF